MNQPATKREIQEFGNRAGVVISHEHPSRRERRRPEIPEWKKRAQLRKSNPYLIGGARIRPQYMFL